MLNLSEAAKESGQSKSAIWRPLTPAGCQQPGPLPATTGSTPPNFTVYFLLERTGVPRTELPPPYR